MDDHDNEHDGIVGVLVVDKPKGPTSHDVVSKLRRTLRMKRIGHAGTLDPLASGVLVVLLGQATKLGPYLTLQDKRYEARVIFGRSTDTLDAQGNTTEEAALPPWFVEEIANLGKGTPVESTPRILAAIEHERTRKAQTPPAYSAIKVDGQRSYDRARRGETVTLEDRPVEVATIAISSAGFVEGVEGVEGKNLAFVDISLDVSKGYYVRSFARDLGQTLGVPSFLGALRRTRSGPFTLEESAPLDATSAALESSIIPLAKTVERCMSTAVLTAAGVIRASQGKQLSEEDFAVAPTTSSDPVAWFSPRGALIAIGEAQQGGYIVRRGFTVGGTALPDASGV
jgi:tRNA pseudouridine55 synthase